MRDPDHDLARDVGGAAACGRAGGQAAWHPRRHLADERALVADDRGVELELTREAHGARHHPAGDEADEDASSDARPGSAARVSGPMLRSSPTSVPSMSSATRPMGRMGSGRRDGGHLLMMPDRLPRRWRHRDARGPASAARDPRDPRQAGEVRLDRARQPGRLDATRATIASPWSAPISSSAEPVVRQRVRQPVRAGAR